MQTKTPTPESEEDRHNPAQEEYEKLTGRYNPDHKDHEAAGNPTDPRGHDTAAGDASDPRGPGPDDIKQQEEAPASPDYSSSHVPDDERVGRGYTKNEKSQRTGWRRYVYNRRAAASGGVIGLIIAAMFGFSVLQGPFQLIHLGQILQLPGTHSKNTIQLRNRGLFRAARTGHVEETRLGKLGSKVYNKTLSQLKEQGIEFTDRNIRGVPRRLRIDTSKNDNFKDLSAGERPGAIADFFKAEGYDAPKVVSLDANHYYIDLDPTTAQGLDFIKATAKTSIGSLASGAVEEGLSMRFVKEAWRLPRLFSPLEKYSETLKNKVASGLSRKQASEEIERERLKTEVGAVANSPEVIPEKSKLKDAIKKRQSAVLKVLIPTAFACAVRNAADSAVAVNRAMIVLPTTVQAADKIAVGSKIQSNQEIDLADAEVVSNTLIDPTTGKSVWEGMALQALTGSGHPGGPDLWIKYKQAFSADTTADNIRDAVQVKVPHTGIKITDIVCNKYAELAQVVVGAVLVVVNLPDGDAGAAAYAAAIAGALKSAVAFGGVIYAIEHFGPELIADKAAVPELLSGPVGGNLMAYGARELANVNARSLGGTAMEGTETSTLGLAEDKEYQQQLASMSLTDRLFNPHSYNSLVSKVIDSTNLSPQNTMASLGRIFTNFGSMFGHAFAQLSPHALADNKPYDWGFPLYGISNQLAEDKKYQDPYENADETVKILKKDNDYINRAKTCFGVEINEKDDWSVIAKHDVNPASRDYAAANCNEDSDSWNRIRLFVMDSRLMDTIACHQGTDEQSCENIGMAGGSEQDTTRTLTDAGSTASGDAQQLAQELLDNSNVSYPYKDTARGLTVRDVLEQVAKTGEGIVDSSDVDYTSVPVSPNLLAALVEYAQDHQLGLNALTNGDHSSDSNHYKGRAIDIACSPSLDRTAFDEVAAKYGGRNNGEVCPGSGHWHYDFP